MDCFIAPHGLARAEKFPTVAPGMCTRYTFYQVEALRKLLAAHGVTSIEDLPARYNVALTTRMPVVTRREGVARIESLAFGATLPAGEPDGRPLLVANARAETITSRPAFRDAVKHRRCLVPADGFFEWRRAGKERFPMLFRRRDEAPFFFAGLWRPAPAEGPASFVIVTTTPNELVSPVHDRMPVLLDEAGSRAWLGEEVLPNDRIAALCVPFPAAAMTAHAVDPRMNHARHEGPDCIAPWTPPAPEPTLFD